MAFRFSSKDSVRAIDKMPPQTAPAAASPALPRASSAGRIMTMRPGFSATVQRAVVRRLYDGLRLTLMSISWCGVSDALMRDFWIISTFPCSTRVVHYANQHAYSKGIAPLRCLRGSSGSA